MIRSVRSSAIGPTVEFPATTGLRRRLGLGLLAVAFAAVSASSHAADYYRRGTMTFNSNTWNQASWWSESVDGTAITAFDPEGHYFNDRELRTGQGTDLTFGGASLTMTGGSISLRRGETTFGASTVPHLIIAGAGASVTNDIGGAARLHANQLTLDGPLSTGPQGNTRVIWLTADNVTGAGAVTNGQGSGLHTTRIGFSNAVAWTGDIVHTWGVLDFSETLFSGGGLVVDTTLSPTINLSHNLSFTSVTIGGTSLVGGVHTFAALSTSFPGVFTGGDLGATITVIPEPSAFALVTALGGVAAVALRRRHRDAR